MEKEKLIELRKLMGTYQDDGTEVLDDARFMVGCEGIFVDLIDWPVNPYKAMYVMATTCWGRRVNKWKQTKPEHRFLVVKAVLEGQSLPLALEAPKFTFVIEGPSRAAFDQIARARIGAVFSAKGMRDNNWSQCQFRIPNAIYKNEKLFESYMSALILGVKAYNDAVKTGQANWQAARAVLPMSVVYGWSMSMNYQALRGFAAKRMKFCEQEDTVATAWLVWEAIRKRFPLLADHMRPGCDYSQKCGYHKTYYLSEVFGCLFKECGRNKCEATNDYAIFNESCSNKSIIATQTGILIPDNVWNNYTWDTIKDSDKKLFMED